MASQAAALINSVFDTSTIHFYRIRMQIKGWHSTSYEAIISIGESTFRDLITIPLVGTDWGGVDQIVTILPTDGRDLRVAVNASVTLSAEAPTSLYLKNLVVDKLTKAEVDDSSLFSGGRRFSYYEGSKMTSQDFNIDSPDTVDGGPVIVVNTVSPNTPSSSPIGTSTVQEGRALVNRTPTSNAS